MRDDGRRTLAILNAIASGDRLTQRELARELGVAVSLVNVSIRRLVRQGLVRVVSSHPARFRYFLTPNGVEERSRLACAQLEWSCTTYKKLRERVSGILQPHIASGARRIALCGTGNAAEIAYICLLDYGLEEIAVFDGSGMKAFLGRPIQELRDLVPESFDRIVITEVDPAGSVGAAMTELAGWGVPADKIVSLAELAGRGACSSPEPVMVV